ncbi:MAG TPA: hypothetical protein PKI46_04555 [Bacteroidales bacterium]|nr:hypothetical protein [Bacteroidales bacterium]
MKTQYIDQLYNDFNTKTETTLKYTTLLHKKIIDTTSDIVEFVKLYENLYDSLSSVSSQVKIPSDTQFAIETENQVQNNNNNINVKEISEKIATTTPLIEYKFQDLLKNLQTLTQALQNYQDITSKIVEAWDDSLQVIQS